MSVRSEMFAMGLAASVLVAAGPRLAVAQWQGWENLGGVILEQPECVSWSANRIDCFARGTDRAMYHRWWNGSSWGGWENLGGVILEAPSCVSWGANRIDCFARGTDRAMYHRWWDGGSWGGWENLGGVILEAPSCVSWSANRIDCFARGTDRAMYHRWYNSVVSRALTISRHNTAPLSNAEADSILADASTVLQTNDGPGDVACGVALTRSGDAGVFNIGDGSLDTSAELQAVFALPGNVKVVDDVNWCANQFNTSYIGCGQTPGTSFITERFTANQEGILWAHEFGHNQGLQHRDTSTDNVMYFSIGSNRRRVNQTECNAFTGQGGLIAMAATTMPAEGATDAAGVGSTDMGMVDQPATATMPEVSSGEEMADEPAPGEGMPLVPMEAEKVPGTPMGGQSSGAGQVPVEEFVTQIYFEGLPLDKAAEYGNEAVQPLLGILADPSMVRYHENAALTLGMIGKEEAVEPLIAYVRRGPEGSATRGAEATTDGASRAAYKGRVGAIIGLGYLANRADSEEAIDFLIEQSRPEAWRGNTLERLPTGEAPAAGAAEDLSKYAIIALGFSADQRAAERLRSLASEGTRAGESAFLAQAKDVIGQSLQILDEVSKKGLVGYYARPE
jgi:hypothetical protein